MTKSHFLTIIAKIYAKCKRFEEKDSQCLQKTDVIFWHYAGHYGIFNHEIALSKAIPRDRFRSRGKMGYLSALPSLAMIARLIAHRMARMEARLMLWLLPTPNTSFSSGVFKWM